MTSADLESLDGAQIKVFVAAIQLSYDEVQFGMLLRMDLERNLADLAKPGPWPQRVYAVVDESQKQGFAQELLEAIEADRPDVERIQGLRAQLDGLHKRRPGTQAIKNPDGDAPGPAQRSGKLAAAARRTRKVGSLTTSEKVSSLQRGIADLEAGSEGRVVGVVRDMPVTNDRPIQGSPSRKSTSNSELLSSSWALEAVGALDSPYRGEGCVVASLGTGIDISHPAFKNIDIRQQDFSGDGNGDLNGHSTHVAGSLFGRDVEGQRIGVAPGVTRVLVAKTLNDLGTGHQSDILRAIQWVLAEGADVICIPMGFDFPRQLTQLIDLPSREAAIAEALLQYNQYSRLYEMIVKMGATGKGAVIVTAAGNGSTAAMRVPVTSPLSIAEGGISAGAVERHGKSYRIAAYSNSYPTLCAPGEQIVSACAGGGLVAMSGTSMACGFVAGVAALWWEHLRKMVGDKATAPMVTAAMLSAANSKFAPDVPATDFGAGLVQAPRSE